MHTIFRFESWEVKSPMLQMVHNLELKRRSYGHLKTIMQSTNGNFAVVPPFRRVFRSCETTLWHTSATSQHPYTHFAAAKWAAKIPLRREIHPPLRKCSKLKKWDAIFFFVFLFSFWLPKWLRNNFQASKWLRKCFHFLHELRNSPLATKWFRSPIATPCQILHLLQKWPLSFKMSCENVFLFSLWLQKWPPSYKMICENIVQSQGKLWKCQQSPAPCI